MRCITFLLACAATLGATASEEAWYPSKYGADDTLGAIANLSPDKVVAAARLVREGKAYRLGVETGPDSPAYSPREYAMTVLQLDAGTGAPGGTNQATGNDDLMYLWMGIGSQIDGLGHMGINHVYYNGHHANDFITPTGLTRLGIEALPPIVGRGVLLDMARLSGQNPMPAGAVFNETQIKAAQAAQDLDIQTGDVVLFHTGWLNKADDKVTFMAGEPGLGVGGARYLAGLGVTAVGSDSWGVEAVPHEDPETMFPVHTELLAKHGVYILENMDTRALAADGVSEFLFVLGVPRFVGAVQAVINPIAIR